MISITVICGRVFYLVSRLRLFVGLKAALYCQKRISIIYCVVCLDCIYRKAMGIYTFVWLLDYVCYVTTTQKAM
jgi:hypothetical protein